MNDSLAHDCGGWPVCSVIVPVWREALTIGECIDHLQAQGYPGRVEVIVVDGEPGASTLAALAGLDYANLDVVHMTSEPGRARQMNAGAARAAGEALVFLHADTRLPANGLRLAVQALLSDTGLAGGAFGLAFASNRPLLRFLGRLADVRNRLTRTPYGDQVQFFRAEVFHSLGGYPEWPLMEDVELMRRLRRKRLPIRILDARVTTSARRYESGGVLRTAARNMTLRLAFALGASPRLLARWYSVQRRKE